MNSNINLKCTDLVPSICFDLSGGSGFHNSCIGVFLIVFFGWVTYRVSQILELYEIIRIMEEEKKIVYLPSLGPFSNELKRLMRVHLSQIIKEKCSISPIQIRKISVLCAIDETTIKTKLIQNSSSSSNPEQTYSLDVSFNVDSELPFSVEMFWGVKYSDVKKLLSGSVEMNDNDTVLLPSNLKTRRKAVGSSISLYNQIKRNDNNTSEGSECICGCEYECDYGLNDYCGNSEFNTSSSSLFEGDFDSENNHKHICDCKNEYIHKKSENIGYINDSLIENGRYETNRTGLEKNGSSSENRYNNIDFSPSNSLINLAQVNPLLYTSIQSNNNSNSFGYYQHVNNNIGERYANFLKNINFDIKRNLMDRIRDNINNSQLFFNSRSGNSNSRWNSSLLGKNTVVLSRAIKRILNRLFYRLNNVNDTTTESLLEMSSQIGINNNRFTNMDVKYINENIINVNNYKDNIYLNANSDNGIYQIDSIFKGKVTKYDKGLSQIHSERIKLTMDYINSCNLLSPYCNYDDNQETINNSLYFDHNNNINNSDRIPLLILIKTNINEYDVDLHNRIMSNNNFRESLTLLNVVLIHFELIQDHYNIPYILYKPIIVEQYYLNFNNCLIEPSDTFGLEDDEFDCLICMSNPKNSVLLPCKHCILCESCLRSLRQDKCPLCRTTFYGFVVLPVNSNISANS